MENEIEKNLIIKRPKIKENLLKTNENNNFIYSKNSEKNVNKTSRNIVIIDGLSVLSKEKKISSKKPTSFESRISPKISKPNYKFGNTFIQPTNIKLTLLSVSSNFNNNTQYNTNNSKSNPSSFRRNLNPNSLKKRKNDVIYAQNKTERQNISSYNHTRFPLTTINYSKQNLNLNLNIKETNKNSTNKYNTANNNILQTLPLKKNESNAKKNRNLLKSASNNRENLYRNRTRNIDYKTKDVKNLENDFNKLIWHLPEEMNNANKKNSISKPVSGKNIK